MTEQQRPYNIGLDIGTSSIGWAVTDQNDKLLHIRGHNGIGVRLFKEGESAAERRGFRTTRRRLSRRRWRLRFLDRIFDAELAKVDPNFLARLKQSNISPLDPNKQMFGNILFDDAQFDDQKFHQQYPTIYHLRSALAQPDAPQADVRLIYLALHHMIKFRGHFLNGAAVEKFHGGQLHLEAEFQELNQIFSNQQRDHVQLQTSSLDEVATILKDNQRTPSDRQRELSARLFVPVDKTIDKENKKLATELLKAVLGLKAKFDVILGVEATDPQAFKLQFSSDDFDDKIAELASELTDEANEILTVLQRLYFSLNLADILTNRQTKQVADSISTAMINRYDDHKHHLKMLKELETQVTQEQRDGLKKAYDEYIDGDKPTIDTFYTNVKKNLDDSELANQIKSLIDLQAFMPKQRSKENGSIPHQLHQRELDQLIEVQGKYYPWLLAAKDKLDALIAFRVPYYVGPMIDPNESDDPQNTKFAWMVRKEAGEITPWNFEEKVDKTGSATNFIKRMTTTDTYLLGEPVLPKNSLLYQQFTVLNELNKLKVDGKALTVDQKKYLYEHVCKKQRRVTLKKLSDCLMARGDFPMGAIFTGTTDQKNMNNTLKTYQDFQEIFGDEIDNPDRQVDFEKMIEWSTIFEDREIFKLKLAELNWLTSEQLERVSKKRYQGWGRLSQKLLTHIVNENGERIIDQLWNTNQNFMEIMGQDGVKQAIQEHNGANVAQTGINETIDELYTSPQNKKAIRQILLVVDDIKKAVGYAPANIMMEFAREDRDDHRLIASRARQLEKTYQEISKNWFDNESVTQELKDQIKNKTKFTDRLYLYFIQGGIDLYTGHPLNIDQLSSYDIDHILPQSFLLDNSLNNRVLTSQSENRVHKEDRLPGETVANKMRPTWKMMREQGLMTQRKYNNLTLKPDQISKFNNRGQFINRQLVETRQVIKLAADIMNQKYQADQTKVVTVKANLTHHMREKFNFYKSRNVNDYHHAFDAYLTVFVGNWLLKEYPKLQPYFVYGDFAKTGTNNLKSFNFLYRFERDHKLNDKGAIDTDKDQQLGYMKRIYRFKKMLVTKQLETNEGALYKQTIYKAPANEKNTKKNRSLINTKKNRPSDIYGGYSQSVTAYMSLVFFKNTFKLIKMPLVAANAIKNSLSSYHDTILKILGSNEFKVLIPKVKMNQLIKEGDSLYTVVGVYKHNAQQLILSDNSMGIITKPIREICDSDLDSVFNELVDNIDKYLNLYKIEDKLTIKEKFYALKNKESKFKCISDILVGTHCNAGRSNLKIIGLSSYWGMFSGNNDGLKINENSQLIYQSPTGLFEHRVKVSDL
ncbi:type II CRISPR RNA-guided endonuclease Cas9 [Fructilactobacillus florum]|uniref:CRISPR-associated endonuclease Cas9 n=1 Tax=Fructilactobacillus florum DSM 22689 = JCM 16035 TaxID=1423745 RepID=A0A0R2CL57_9LACO|nr:type II CRISPR RNA-guided endonuclease Cas9 [Fructilactobacillus florum]KRM92351.1 hypothetical protein FC87_GL000484 [Fructilactobacillus florum DSM 22689 = JCM 16035]